jgi:hypothetical protein
VSARFASNLAEIVALKQRDTDWPELVGRLCYMPTVPGDATPFWDPRFDTNQLVAITLMKYRLDFRTQWLVEVAGF